MLPDYTLPIEDIVNIINSLERVTWQYRYLTKPDYQSAANDKFYLSCSRTLSHLVLACGVKLVAVIFLFSFKRFLPVFQPVSEQSDVTHWSTTVFCKLLILLHILYTSLSPWLYCHFRKPLNPLRFSLVRFYSQSQPFYHTWLQKSSTFARNIPLYNQELSEPRKRHAGGGLMGFFVFSL